MVRRTKGHTGGQSSLHLNLSLISTTVTPLFVWSCYAFSSLRNQKLIEAAMSSCCYSNREHCPPFEMFFFCWHVCCQGFKIIPLPLCLQCSCYCTRCSFCAYNLLILCICNICVMKFMKTSCSRLTLSTSILSRRV